MPSISKPLELYKTDNLLVLHWLMQAPLEGSIDILFNEQLLPKPYLATRLANVLEMVIIVDARTIKLTKRKNSLLIKSTNTNSNEKITRAEFSYIHSLSQNYFADYPEEIQGRIFMRLFEHSHRRFINFPASEIAQLIKRYSCRINRAYLVDEHQCFLQLPCSAIHEIKLSQVHLSLINNLNTIVSGQELALLTPDSIYLLFSYPAVQVKGVVSYSELCSLPFASDEIKAISNAELLTQFSDSSTLSQAVYSFINTNLYSLPLTKTSLNPQADSDLQGAILGIRYQQLIGWARNNQCLQLPICVDIYLDKHKIATLEANQSCQDLGIETDCAFSLKLEAALLKGANKELTVNFAATEFALTNSPVLLGKGYFDGEYSLSEGITLTGWIQQRTLDDNGSYAINYYLDEQVFLTQLKSGGQKFALLQSLPAQVLDSEPHSFKITVNSEFTGTTLLFEQAIQHHYNGAIETIEFNKIAGWLVNTDYPARRVTIDLVINNKSKLTTHCTQPRVDVQSQLSLSSPLSGFSFELPEELVLQTCCKIDIKIANTTKAIFSRQIVLTPKDIIIRSLIGAAEYLKSSAGAHEGSKMLSASINAEINANNWVRTQILAPVIQTLRQKSGLPKTISLNLESYLRELVIQKSDWIDVIIPVYKGYEQTIQCIQSVLQAKNHKFYSLIVINDAAPDGRLKYALQALALEHNKITLLENEQNLGFVGTVNIGMQQHTDRDVILLNSDTLVGDYWLDRLYLASLIDQNIATVTPFSNNATICSFPDFNTENDFPTQINLQQLNDLFYEENQDQVVDLPTAVGFCMFIKREALNDIGYFDQKTWHKGYCEENDFCLRAANLGWRHILAADVFVQHHGSVSFAAEKSQHLTDNLAKLNQRYPDYMMTVQRFITLDPLAPLRNNVIKRLLLAANCNFSLFISHAIGGGTKTHIEHLIRLLDQQKEAVLKLIPLSNERWQLRSFNPEYTLSYRYPEDFPQLINDLQRFKIHQIHYHHVLGLPKKIWQLPELLNCRYFFTAHDFMPICPRINMIDETQYYCEQSQFDLSKCQRCIALNGVDQRTNLTGEFDNSVQQWRDHYAQVLKQAESVICPSKTTADIYQKHFNLPNISVKPHPDTPFAIYPVQQSDNDNMISVAVIGAIGEHKGYQLLLDCAKNALKEGLNLHFVVIGYTCDDATLLKLSNVSITGAYQSDEQLGQFIRQNQCTLALFLSVWPETYCYTLTEALTNNLYPIVLNYGALAERIAALDYGTVLARHIRPVEINKALLKIARTGQLAKSILFSGKEYGNLLTYYYV